MRSVAASPRASRNRNPVRQENGLEAAVLGERDIPAPFPAVANDGLIQAIAPPVLVAVPNVPVTDEDKAVAQRYFDHVRKNSAKHVMTDDEKFILYAMRKNYVGLDPKASFVDVKNSDVTELKWKSVEPISMVEEWAKVIETYGLAMKNSTMLLYEAILQPAVGGQVNVAPDELSMTHFKNSKGDEHWGQVNRTELAFFSGDTAMLTVGTQQVRFRTIADSLKTANIPDYVKMSENWSHERFLSDEGLEGRLDDPLLFWCVVHPASFLASEEAKRLTKGFPRDFPLEPFYGFEGSSREILRALYHRLLDEKMDDITAVHLRGEQFSRADHLKDKESASIVMRIIGSTLDALFRFDGESRLAFRALIAYVTGHDDKKGRNSDSNGWTAATGVQFYVTMVDGLRVLWENLKEKASIYKHTEGRDVVATANALVEAAVVMDTNQTSQSLGEKLKNINRLVTDPTRIATFKREFPTSLERFPLQPTTRKRGYESHHNQSASQKAPRQEIDQNRICLFSMSATSGFGNCKHSNCSYSHPRYADRGTSDRWRNVANKILAEGANRYANGERKHIIHDDWTNWARTLLRGQNRDQTTNRYGPSSSGGRTNSYPPVAPYNQTDEVKVSEVKKR